jgi:hypothetical protein
VKKVILASFLGGMLISGQAFAKDVKASSHCPMTGVTGIGHGQTFEVAVQSAIKACIAKGGISSCCYKFTRKLS